MARKRLRLRIDSNDCAIDLTPMIDIVFLMLVFFILTTSFRPEEQQLAGLLPQGGAGVVDATVLPPPTVRISIVPIDLPERATEAEYQVVARRLLHQGPCDAVDLRMGTQVLGRIDLRLLRSADHAIARDELERIHALLHGSLAQREIPVQKRSEAPPVEIHAWSGLPWASVTTVFDAVRSYEAERHGSQITTREDLNTARSVAFAAPPVRNVSTKNEGRELFDLMHLL